MAVNPAVAVFENNDTGEQYSKNLKGKGDNNDIIIAEAKRMNIEGSTLISVYHRSKFIWGKDIECSPMPEGMEW